MIVLQIIVVALYIIVLLEILAIILWGIWHLLKAIKKLVIWIMKEINIRINITIK